MQLRAALHQFGVVLALVIGQERSHCDVTGDGENVAVIEHAFEAGGWSFNAHATFSEEPVAAAGALGIAVGNALCELSAVILWRCSVTTPDASPSM